MPKLKKISVDITTSKEERLPSLGTEIGFNNTLCESYILSQTGTRFGVIVKPDDDFFAPHIKIDKHIHPQRGGGNRPENYPDVNPSEWHLLAEVYLDGRLSPEATTIIYLPWHVRAEERLLDSSITWDSDGKAVERLWHFQEVGLENFVKTLSMSESDLDTSSENAPVGEAASAATEKDLLKMMQNLKTDKSNQDPLTLKPGQISVALWKIQILDREGLDDPPVNSGGSSGHLQAVNEDQPTDLGESSHFIQIKEKFNVKFTRKRHYYKILDEEAYARFIFNYRSVEQLMKMKLLQTEKHTRRGIDNVVPYLRPLTFGEQVKPSEPTNLLGEPKESLAKARSISKLNDQGLIAQQIRSFSLKKPTPGLGSFSQPVESPKFTKLEGFPHPEPLVGGDNGYDGMNESTGNFIRDTKDHAGKPVSDNACCGSKEIDGSMTTENFKTLTLHDLPSLKGSSRDNYKTRVSTRPVAVDSEDARLRDELMVKAPTSVIFYSNVRSLKRFEAINTEEGHFENKSKACTQDNLGTMSMEGDQLTASMGVSAAPAYQGPQMTKRVYRSEDEDNTEGPNVKRSRRVEHNVAYTSMTSHKL